MSKPEKRFQNWESKFNILNSLVADCGASRGSDFFRAFVSSLSANISFQYVSIGKITGLHEDMVETLAIFENDRFIDNFIYPLKGTPCESALRENIVFYSSGTQASPSRFKTEGKSYLGICLHGADGKKLGILSMKGDEPLSAEDTAFIQSIVKTLVPRIGSEIINAQDMKDATDYRIILDSSPAMIWFKDDKNNILKANKTAVDSIGLSLEAVIGKNVAELYPADAEKYLKDDLEVIRSGKPKLGIVEPYETGDGKRIWIRTDKIPHRNEKGYINGVVVFAIDITEQFEVSERLRFLQYGLDRTNDGTFWLQLEDARLVYVNHQACESLGYTSDELLNMSVFDIDPDYQQTSWPQFREVLRQKRMLKFETRHKRKDGTIFPVEITAHCVNFQGIEYAVTNVRDISERKKIEKDLQEANENLEFRVKERTADLEKLGQELRKSQRSISTLVDNFPGMVYRCKNDKAWSVEYASAGCLDLTGYSVDDFISQRVSFGTKVIHPEDQERVWTEVQEGLASRTSYQLSYRILTSTNKLKWVWEQGLGIYSPENELEALEGFITDISERKEAEARLQHFTEELKRSNQDLDEFAYLASHDLQEPLRKIISFADRLQTMKYSEDEKALDYLHRIEKSAERMKNYIQDLLEYSRIATQPKHHEKRSLQEMCEHVLDDLSVQMKTANATIYIHDLPALEVDPVQFPKVFQNLISNAIKYHRKDTAPIVNISSVYIKEANKWNIEVADNGIGIDEAHFKRIFKPFERLHGRSAYEGSGIGLSICEKIVHRHNGDITVHSNNQNGTTFVVTLPASPA